MALRSCKHESIWIFASIVRPTRWTSTARWRICQQRTSRCDEGRVSRHCLLEHRYRLFLLRNDQFYTKCQMGFLLCDIASVVCSFRSFVVNHKVSGHITEKRFGKESPDQSYLEQSLATSDRKLSRKKLLKLPCLTTFSRSPSFTALLGAFGLANLPGMTSLAAFGHLKIL